MCSVDRVGPRPRAASRLPGFLILFSLAACGGGTDGPPPEQGPGAELPTPSVEREALAAIFPATASRGLVLNNCAGCHSPACAALGQRDAERWHAVEVSHASYIPGLSKEDHGKIFDYLKRHFDESTPEPRVPPELLGPGCPRL